MTASTSQPTPPPAKSPWPTSPHGPDDNHTSDGRCKYPDVCAADGHVSVQGHIETVCEEAGYGLMVQVFEVIRDRGDVSDERLLALTADDVDAFYDAFIGKAINTVESSLLGDFD